MWSSSGCFVWQVHVRDEQEIAAKNQWQWRSLGWARVWVEKRISPLRCSR